MPLIISSSCLNQDKSFRLFDPACFAPEKLILVIDADRCIGCRACEIHCWNEHRTEREIREASISVVHIERPLNDEGATAIYFPQTCSHCEEPECLRYCPAGAIKKEEVGIVAVYKEKCIGCQTCLTMCPNYFFSYSSSSKRTLKCDGCLLRLQQGLWPACATKCSMKAIYIGYPKEIARILKEKKAGGDVVYIVGNTAKRRKTTCLEKK